MKVHWICFDVAWIFFFNFCLTPQRSKIRGELKLFGVFQLTSLPPTKFIQKVDFSIIIINCLLLIVYCLNHCLWSMSRCQSSSHGLSNEYFMAERWLCMCMCIRIEFTIKSGHSNSRCQHKSDLYSPDNCVSSTNGSQKYLLKDNMTRQFRTLINCCIDILSSHYMCWWLVVKCWTRSNSDFSVAWALYN